MPAPTAEPSSEPKADDSLRELVHISHYTPWTGGPNCSRFIGGECVSRMASGEPWQSYVDRAAACPPEWPFGLRFRLPDSREFTCLDRGGNIKYGYTARGMAYDGLGWVDLLTADPGYQFGEVVEIELLK